MTTSASPVRPSATLGVAATAALDAVVILVFAAVGRREHDSGNAILGVFDTAWPFLVGALAGHLLIRFALRREAVTLLSGVVVWICAVALGMVLRQLTGDGTAFAFIVVATSFLGFFLIGWRAVAALLAARRTR